MVRLTVAAAFASSAFLVSPLYAGEAKVTVYGMPPWLSLIAERSLSAVMENIPAGQSRDSVERVVGVVAEKIFTGFRPVKVAFDRGRLRVIFEPAAPTPEWGLELQPPALKAPAYGWFSSDLAKAGEIIKSFVVDLPVDALAWCGEGLRDAVSEALKPVLPGWRPGLVVLPGEGTAVLRVSFTPELPLILAVTPSFYSNSLPTLLYDELKEDLLEQVSAIIGLPVLWAELHAREISDWAEAFLSGNTLVQRTKSKASVTLSPAPVARANVRVESSRYTIWGWSAVYAGTSDRSAELGIHLGRKAQILPHMDVEIYGEGIMELQEWSVEGRFGVRGTPWDGIWLGGEYSTKDEMFWGRFSIDPRLRKPYAWFRVREDGELNAALGWKATEFISFEIHYDSLDGDSWSLRILGNL